MANPYNSDTLTPTCLRVDAAIHPSRYYRPVVTLGFLVVLWVLALLAGLLWWHYVLLLAACAFTLYFLPSGLRIQHISQPPLNRPLTEHWQLLVQTSPRPIIWQAKLLSAQHYGKAVRLSFMCIEPKVRPLSLIIYVDQLSAADWYALSVLAYSAPQKS